MWKWLLALLLALTAATQTQPDYVGTMAVEAGYASLLPSKVTVKKPNTADCKTCNGTGRVRSGDDQGWTKCPDCQSGDTK